MAGLAEALRDIHRVGVVHRDLKPSNVLLAEDGPKVIDFGISRPTDSELRTETGKLIGTPPFMAPEQFQRPREVGPAADVFALGVGAGARGDRARALRLRQPVHRRLPGRARRAGPDRRTGGLSRRWCGAAWPRSPTDRPTPDELMRELRSVGGLVRHPGVHTGAADARAPEDGAARRGAGGHGRAERPARRSRQTRGARGRGARPRRARRPGRRCRCRGGTAPRAQDHRRAESRRDGCGGWEAVPGPEGGGMPQCAHGTRGLLCAVPGAVSALDPADGRTLWRHASSGTTRERDRRPCRAGCRSRCRRRARRRAWRRSTRPRASRCGSEDMSAYDGRAARRRHAAADRAPTATVTGVDSASGEIRWTTGSRGGREPVLRPRSPRTALAYATSPAGDGRRTRVTAVDPATGDVRWDAG